MGGGRRRNRRDSCCEDSWFTPQGKEEDGSAVEPSVHEFGAKLPSLSPRTDTMSLTLNKPLEPVEKRVVGICKAQSNRSFSRLMFRYIGSRGVAERGSPSGKGWMWAGVQQR